MALVRLPSTPSAPCVSTNHLHHQIFQKTASIPLLKLNLSSNTLPLSFSHSQTLPSRTNNNHFRHLVLHFSSTTQEPDVDSSSSPDVVATSDEEEEYSRTRLIAQNVPWTCTTEDIRSLFEKFGTVLNVELSVYSKTRNRGLAFVTMGSPEEADNALRSLEAYEYEGRTLRMNYAKPKKEKASPLVSTKPPETFNLYVANLPFDAREKDLKEFFNGEGASVVSADIIYHDSPRRSSGYGFVAFKTKKEATNALSTFQGKEFKGRQLRVARSRPFMRQRKQGLKSDNTSIESNSEAKQVDTAEGS